MNQYEDGESVDNNHDSPDYDHQYQNESEIQEDDESLQRGTVLKVKKNLMLDFINPGEEYNDYLNNDTEENKLQTLDKSLQHYRQGKINYQSKRHHDDDSYELNYEGPHSQNPNYTPNSSMNSRMIGAGFDPVKKFNARAALYVDLKIDDDDDEEDNEYEINTKSDDHKVTYKRVYDAKYKIPPSEKVQSLNYTMVKNNDEKMQNKIKKYKRYSNFITTLLMGLASVGVFMLYLNQFIELIRKPYYVTRARVKITSFQDNEYVTVNMLKYFLYRNESDSATDSTDANNQIIVSNLDELCNVDEYALFDTLDKAISVKHNVQSSYMFISVAFDLLLIGIVSLFNVMYISFYLKEHQVPIIFRNPDSSLYYDIQRAKNFFFVCYLTLTGILAQLNFYDAYGKCLHTQNEKSFSSTDVDMYQYALLALLWVVAIPFLFLIGMISIRDNLKVGCYPVVIANLIFAFMLFILSQIVIINAIMFASSILLQICHLANYGIFGISLINNIYYQYKYAKIDVVASDKNHGTT
ncbi:UNKNOWN [Stylonychia lemnae]|uniref:Uncharacterized protein n=1 Tax=Stylonychia lemnae TaxID=5949 RepID=A0A078B7U1_STYLE|nr:UNKNOWN [Stylonychia lemnae]|eukprot:CDW90585.1 UNKNOWN [Stylonychia lemnae]